MALIKKDNNQQVKIKHTANVDRNLTPNKKFKSSNRRTLKVDPPVYQLIKSLAYITDKKMYDLVREMANAYLENNINDRQRENVLRNIDDIER
ncbi:DNA segregation protein PrgO [Lentilactobacillus hilgardii]|uniref:DNA segregation protein PrgO n=1 Tax=Lentilactobacillus hilgardii TaxID=1588 RepID=UPI0021A62A91|nr:DNA segregation protein PrgO [Lentilactobacillus hilgardii]MCP9333949.1 hypothetical protein [Lentilactobacillus hilgardii]MCP9350535.1 hypothetical protein [Lentilactobacillus hilgardii]MCP9353431.1 hypothetical protein [Lentilactobacillus hilgardii]MCT3397102.1 hypothetical protein [Lentilactobacillus hilgardii]MCT3399866.1 hypothetical protein [Lentilactobacillus hilgardii]